MPSIRQRQATFDGFGWIWVVRLTLAVSLVLVIGLISFQPVSAQSVDSIWVLDRTQQEWLSTATWSEGVPNQPGDMARLTGDSRRAVTGILSGQATIGELEFGGGVDIRLAGLGNLLFDNASSNPARIVANATLPGTVFKLDVPFQVADEQQFEFDINANSQLNLFGALPAGPFEIRKRGDGQLVLEGNAGDWTGNFEINAGRVVVQTSTGLGSGAATTTVRDAELMFEASSPTPLVLDNAVVGLANHELSGNVRLEGNGYFLRPLNPLVDLGRGGLIQSSLGDATLSGEISGPGSLMIENLSRDSLLLSGVNSYTGHTTIKSGRYFINSLTTLGTTDGGTTIQGGEVVLQVPTEETFRVETDGLLDYNSGDFIPSQQVVLAGGKLRLPARDVIETPVVLDGGGSSIEGRFSSNSSWLGGSTGTGSLSVGGNLVVDAPLSHTGDLILSGVTLNTANSYTGDTYLEGDATINHPDAFGTATTPIVVRTGELLLNTLPAGDRDLVIQSGSLVANVGDTPINSSIILGGGSSARITGGGIFNGPIDYVSSPGVTPAHLRSGAFNGTIRGNYDLFIGDRDKKVVLNAANDIRGRARIVSGLVEVNQVDALNLANSQIETGTLSLNVPAQGTPLITGPLFSGVAGELRLNVPQTITDTWIVHDGNLEVASEVAINRLVLLGSNEIASLATVEGGSLRIDGEVRSLVSGQIGGKLTGNGEIRTFGRNLSLSGDLTEFAGSVHVENGLLSFRGPSEVGARMAMHVYQGGTLSLSGQERIESDIFLHNAHGSDFNNAALQASSNSTRVLAGRLDIGDQGSTVSGGIRIEGKITGNNLSVVNGGFSINAPQTELTGILRASDAGISLGSAGSLHGLDAILLEQGSSLSLAPLGSNDQLDDNTQVISRGASIGISSIPGQPATETIGTLKLERGSTRLSISSDHAGGMASLVINQVQRETGAVLSFSLPGRVSSGQIDSLPMFDDTMIGAWARAGNGFATITSIGSIGVLQHTSYDLNSAGPNDHVMLEDFGQTLWKDTVIAALSQENSSRVEHDLDGHQLTIRSGGLNRTHKIINGRLTAGDGQAAELIFYNTLGVGADIVDNTTSGPETGSVSVVQAEGQLRLSGNNSYTGGTWAIDDDPFFSSVRRAEIVIEDLAAIPADDRVFVNGGGYNLRELDSGTAHLAELHLRDGGLVESSQVAIDAENYYLEDGRILAPLSGVGTIYKETSGLVSFPSGTSPDFAGSVIVRDGVLSLRHDTLPNATIAIEGGELRFDSDRGTSQNFTLDGGALEGSYFSGNIHLASDSTIVANRDNRFAGTLTGNADLTIQGRLSNQYFTSYVGLFGDATDFTGNINVETGALYLGRPDQLGDSDISVQAGARLFFGNLASTAPLTVLSNDIHLHGGSLISAPPTNSGFVTRMSGDVYVHDEAVIGALRIGDNGKGNGRGLVLAGRVILDDHSTVFGISDSRHSFYNGNRPLVEVSGQLLVGQQNVWSLGPASLLISGEIRPSAAESSIDFRGVDTSFSFQGKLATEADKRLEVTFNGERLPFELQGTAATIAGDGTLVGDFSLSDGAVIDPGNSPGTLTIDGDATIGSGARYKWEVLRSVGTAGEQWDLLQVSGALIFNATPDNPWVLEVNGLEGLAFGQPGEWLLASGAEILGFDPSAIAIQGLPGKLSMQPAVYSDGANLFLLVVPEPATAIMLLPLAMVATGGRRRLRC